MNVYDQERARIDSDLREGRITQREHTQLARGIDRHQRAEGLSDERTARYRAAQQNTRRRAKQSRLASQLTASIDLLGDRL